MKTLKCPECKTEIARFWINPIRKDQLVGRCSACRKMVNLGSSDQADKAPQAGPKGKEQTAADSGKRKAASRAGRNSQRKPAAGAKRQPVRTGKDVPVEQPGKRGRVLAGIRDFFGV